MSKKIAVITGASKGIGRESARVLAKAGYYVILLGRNMSELESVIELISADDSEGEYHCIDLTDYKKTADIVDALYCRHKRIDLLVNCAGIGCFGSIDDIDVDDFVNCLNVNLNAIFNLTKYISKIMKNQISGQIINISSIAGEKGFQYGSAYVSSKFALEGFTQVLWEEIKKYEVRVCTIKSGLVNTGFYDNMRMNYDNMKRMQYAPTAEDIAKVLEFVVKLPPSINISEIVLRPIKKQAQDLFTRILNDNYS